MAAYLLVKMLTLIDSSASCKLLLDLLRFLLNRVLSASTCSLLSINASCLVFQAYNYKQHCVETQQGPFSLPVGDARDY